MPVLHSQQGNPQYVDPMRRWWSCRHCDARNKEIGRYCRKCGQPRYERSRTATNEEFEAFQRQLVEQCGSILNLPAGWRASHIPQQRFTTYSEARLEHLEQKAAEKRISEGLTTFREEYARAGLDWETELEDRMRERALLHEAGRERSAIRTVWLVLLFAMSMASLTWAIAQAHL